MFKKLTMTLIMIFTVLMMSFSIVACSKVEFEINFMVDNETYAVVTTSGDETISMPANPTKDGYTFAGWYWDEGVWTQPFTANSLLDAPLSSDMSVYAKFNLNHTHAYTSVVTDPTCTERGYTTYTCECGDTYVDNHVDELGHLFTDYKYNNDAKCGIDGTETAICDHDCGESDTRTKTGSALAHEYGAWVTNNNGTHTRTCSHDNSHKETKDCNGGTATCTEKAVCIDCGAEYGNLAGHIAKEEWSTTEKYHYHACKTENCTEKLDKENHTFDKNKQCTTCGYINTALLGTEISSDIYEIDGANLYVKVPNTQTYFAFAETINVAEGATYKVYSDIQCKEESNIPSYIVNDLVVGDNTYYFLVNNEGSFPKIYTVTVRRRPMYTVNFVTNGGTAVASQTVEEDSFATVPTTTKTGYTFNGWDYNFNTPITKNTTITAKWVANKDTKYTVIYYLQNLNDNNYTPYETLELKGTTNTTAKAEIKEYAHFTYYSYNSTISGNISPDGSRVLRVYYTRDKYTITTNRNNNKAGTITSGGTYKYDKQITLTATTNDGYTFLGWYDGETKVNNELSYTFNVSKTITLTAKWTANTDTKYRVEYYLQNLEDDNYTLDNTRSYEDFGTTDTTETVTPETIEHFTLNSSMSVLSGNIDGKGGLVLKVYYTLDTYTITTNRNNNKAGTITSGGTYKYDKQITLTATTNDGYTWLGWFDGETKAYEELSYTFNVGETITLTAKWTANTDTKYVVEYYLQNLEDDNYTLDNTRSYEDFGTTDTTASVTPETIEHFTLNSSMSVLSGNIDGKGGLVLKVYYIRNVYTLSMNDSSAGSITNTDSYKYGSSAFNAELVSINLGYDFVGWYNGDELLSTDLAYTFTATQNVMAKFEVKEEMAIFNFNSTTTTCSITGIKDKTVTEIVVPDYVTSISSGAFSGCPIEKATIPTLAISYIKNSALQEVIITSGSSIGSSAFSGCSSLTSIVIPDSVTSIGSSAFYGCSSLTSITLPFVGATKNGTSNMYFGYIFGASSYSYNDDYVPTSLKSVTITGGKSIGTGAFYNCWLLTSIEIPDSVTSIGNYAFLGCSSLTSVVIGDSVTIIYDYAFYDCYKLVEVYNKSTLNITKGSSNYGYVGYYALVVYTESYTSKLSTDSNGYIIYTDGNDKILVGYNGVERDLILPDEITAINSYAFRGCASLTSITIPSSVTSIGDRAFYKCSSLTSIVIPDSVTSLGSSAFEGCSSLTSVVIPDSVTSIGKYAFYNCSKLTSVVIPDSVTYIGEYAFDLCFSLTYNIKDGLKYLGNNNNKYLYLVGVESNSITSATIDNNCRVIGSCAFYHCRSLTSIEIPNSVTSIGSSAFSYCSSLTSVVIGDSVTSIGEDAFYDCDSLTSIVIPDSVTSIGSSAFSSCSSLTSIVIPDSVTSIGDRAFYECSSLTSILVDNNNKNYTSIDGNLYNKNGTIIIQYASGKNADTFITPDSVTSIGDYAFYECDSLTSVVIGDSVTSIGNGAFEDCTSLTSVVIPDSVTSIGDYAFEDCTSLTSVVIGDSVTSIGKYAFYNCSSLTSIEIPNSVTSIGEDAFFGCSSLTSVVIPDSVTSIGEFAFYNCRSLTSIKYRGTQSQWSAISKGSDWNLNTGYYTITYNYTGE